MELTWPAVAGHRGGLLGGGLGADESVREAASTNRTDEHPEPDVA